MAAIKISFITWLLISLNYVSYSQAGWSICYQNSAYDFYSLHFINNNTGFVLDVSGRVLKTTNSGVNWAEISNLLSDVNDIDFVNELTGFICGDTYCSILKTTNGGYNWEIKALYPAYMFDIDFISNDLGYAVSENGYIVKSSNSGNNWVTIYSSQWNSFYSISVINPLIVFASGNKVIKTTNGGVNWIDITPVPSNASGYFSSVCFLNNDSGIVTVWDQIYATTNSGQSWSSYIDSIWYHDVTFSDEKTAYACGHNGSIIKTTNNGINWYRKPTNVNNILTALCFTSINTGYCAGREGVVLKTTNGGEPIGINPISNETPQSFSLSQNYPNPFNPVTKIKFQAPHSPPEGGMQEVSLIIYDVLGKEVAVIFSSPWGRIGGATYEAEWDGTNYTSGVYFYRLAAGDFTETKKMVLIK